MKLYSFFRSGSSYRLRIALNLKGLDYEYIGVNIRNGENLNNDFKAINPQGLVPALETDEGIFTQSTAIMEWLEERYPTPALLPDNATDRARVRAMVALISNDVHPINNRRILQTLKGEFNASDEIVNNWAQKWITEGFNALETMVSADKNRAKDFCFGRSPTLADACLIPQIGSARRFKLDMQQWPNLLAIDTACAKIEAFKKASPQNQPDLIV